MEKDGELNAKTRGPKTLQPGDFKACLLSVDTEPEKQPCAVLDASALFKDFIFEGEIMIV